MSGQLSISHWIQQLKEGEQAGIQALWDRYFARLVELARQRLRGAPRPALPRTGSLLLCSCTPWMDFRAFRRDQQRYLSLGPATGATKSVTKDKM
jgi:hypothetical protein